MKNLELNEMEEVVAGGTVWSAAACGAGIATAIFAPEIFAFFAEATVGACITAASE
jgi:hypothetical protein